MSVSKLSLNIQFFSEAGFAKKMEQLWRHVERYLADTKTSRSKVVLVVPDERGDSADRHVYTALKTFEILSFLKPKDSRASVACV